MSAGNPSVRHVCWLVHLTSGQISPACVEWIRRMRGSILLPGLVTWWHQRHRHVTALSVCGDFGLMVCTSQQTEISERTCPMSCTNHRTCPTDMVPADMFLSMLRNICPLEICPLACTHDRICPLKLVRGPVSADMSGRVYEALHE